MFFNLCFVKQKPYKHYHNFLIGIKIDFYICFFNTYFYCNNDAFIKTKIVINILKNFFTCLLNLIKLKNMKFKNVN